MLTPVGEGVLKILIASNIQVAEFRNWYLKSIGSSPNSDSAAAETKFEVWYHIHIYLVS